MFKEVMCGMCSLLLAVQVLGGVVVKAGIGELEYDSAGRLWLKSASSRRRAELQPTMRLGLSGRILAWDQKSSSQTASGLMLRYRSSTLRWTLRFSSREKLILVESNLENHTEKELWVEPGLRLKIASPGQERRFWNGLDYMQRIADKPLERCGIKHSASMPFPATAVEQGKEAFFLGHVPYDPVSYASTGYDPSQEWLRYVMRFVLPPQGQLEFRQTLGTCNSTYGCPESVIQCYYESLPECWTPIMGQENPYVWGYHAHYANWCWKPDPEKSRRLRMSLDWAYCPYRRSGDMRMAPALWKYDPVRPFNVSKQEQGQKLNLGTMGLDEYIAWRRKIFHAYGQKYGLMFYNTVSGTWCEYQLAKERYEDGMILDPGVVYDRPSWSTTHDREVLMFPLGTSFGNVFYEDLAFLARDLKLPGFALDCAFAGAYYRGKAVEQELPGRAWDSQGRFLDQSVAINAEVDYIHSLKLESGNPLTCWINGYLKGDYVMAEASFLNINAFKRWMPLLRWHIGPRPGCVHGHGYRFGKLVPDWPNKDKEFAVTTLGKLSDYVIMNEFSLGLTGDYLTQQGAPQQVYNQPELLELIRAGWQATVPVTLEKGMEVAFRARYGRGVNSYVFLGNSSSRPMSGRIGIDSVEISGGVDSLLFVRKFRVAAQSVNCLSGPWTEMMVSLPTRMPVIYEAVAGFKGGDASGQWCVTSSKDIHRQCYVLDYLRGKPFSADLKSRTIRHFSKPEIRLNGLPHDATSPLEVRPGDSVELTYQSSRFISPAKDILQFPFVDTRRRANFAVRVFGVAEGMNLALRFREYFEFCQRKGLVAGHEINIGYQNDMKNSGREVHLMIGNGGPTARQKLSKGISVGKEGNLIVKASTFSEADELITALFEVMDRRFEYFYPFQAVQGLHYDQVKHFGLEGKCLDLHRYFEGARP